MWPLLFFLHVCLFCFPHFLQTHLFSVSLVCHLWTERSSLYSYSQDEEKWQGKDFSALIFLLVVWISTTSGRICGNTMGCMCQHWKSELESSQFFFFFPACKKASSLGGILGERIRAFCPSLIITEPCTLWVWCLGSWHFLVSQVYLQISWVNFSCVSSGRNVM